MRGTTPLGGRVRASVPGPGDVPGAGEPVPRGGARLRGRGGAAADAERAAETERNERNRRNDTAFRAEQQQKQHARVPRESRARRAESRARGGGPRRVTRDAERIFGVGRRRYAAPLLHFWSPSATRSRRARARGGGSATRGRGWTSPRSRPRSSRRSTVSARRRAPRLATALPGRRRRVAAARRPRPRPTSGLETAADAFADEHAYAALPLALVLTSDEGFVEAARRRDSESAGLGPTKTPSQTPSPAQSRTALTGAVWPR